MEVRETRREDAEAIRRVHRESIVQLSPAAYRSEQVEAWAAGGESADYTVGIESDSTWFVVVERDRDIRGFGSLRFESPGEYETSVDAEVTGVYVHPTAVREGFGTDLLSEPEREARSRGRNHRPLRIAQRLPFYEHRGYERARVYEHEFSGDRSIGVTGCVVEMNKDP